MNYIIKEMFYSLQGEGFHSGRPAVFCRFAGCNLWSGHEKDRASARCRICDTDFVGADGAAGGVFRSADEVAAQARLLWPDAPGARPYVVCTGGEPLLQLNAPLIEALHDAGFEIGVETNGTLPSPAGVDWVCVSPKADTELVVRCGNELKLLFPQEGVDPANFLGLPFEHFCLQPVDGTNLESATHQALRYCLDHPRWRLSLQIHKLLRIQ